MLGYFFNLSVDAERYRQCGNLYPPGQDIYCRFRQNANNSADDSHVRIGSDSTCVRGCVWVHISYADWTVGHGSHINYRQRYVAAVVGRDGTLITSKEDLFDLHGDICHSMEKCYPIRPSFCGSSSTSVRLACPIWLVTSEQGQGKKVGEETAAVGVSVNLAVWTEQHGCRADVGVIKSVCLAH